MFLSLDAVAEGEAFFRTALAEAADDHDRLSASLMLAQLLLLQGKHAAYARLATETLAPRLPLLFEESRRLGGQFEGFMVNASGQLCLFALLPLAAPGFVVSLDRDEVARLLPRWQRLRDQITQDQLRRCIDLVLHALHGRLGQEKEQHEVAARFNRELAAQTGMPTPDTIVPWLEDLRRRWGVRR
jgi:hypothetical protein